MAETGPAVSVVIPTRQRRDLLRRALQSLSRQSIDPSAFEVIVSVDGADDGTREMLETDAPAYALRAVEGPHRGRAAACNRALEVVRGQVVVILDDDMEASPALLERHASHHPNGSRTCVMGAVPVRTDRSSPRAARYVAAKFRAHMVNLATPGHVFVPRDFYTGNASLRAEVLREVGGFEEAFAAYGNEDVELWVRLAMAGVTFRYDPEARADQQYGKELSGLVADTVEKGSTTVLLARRHPEVFDTLRLADPYEGSRPWLVLRALLLTLARHLPAAVRLVLEAGSKLERIGLWRTPLYYRALLDYAFWVGVERALGDLHDDPQLNRLARQLQRGPIALLLHR